MAARHPQRRSPRTDLRHDPARRRAVAGHLAEQDREAGDRPPARAARGRRDRGRLPDRLARRLRGRAGDRARGAGPGHRRAGARRRRRHRRRLERGQGLRPSAHPHVHLHLGHPHRAPDAEHARGRQGPGPRGRRPGQGLLRRRGVLAHGRLAQRPGVHRRGAPDRPRRGRHHDQRARHRGLLAAHRVRGDVGRAVPAGARPGRGHDLDALPRRPRRGRGQLAGRSRGGLPPGGVRHQRHRRARGQRVAGGDRDAVRACARPPTASGPACRPPRSPRPAA